MLYYQRVFSLFIDWILPDISKQPLKLQDEVNCKAARSKINPSFSWDPLTLINSGGEEEFDE